MREEYDFGKGVRGKHAGKKIRIVGDKTSQSPTKPEERFARESTKPKPSSKSSVKRKQ